MLDFIGFLRSQNYQKIDISNIKCNKCNVNNRSNTNEMYKCITCNNNICSEIENHKEDDIQFHFHNKEKHKIIERKDYKPKDDDLPF